MQTPDTKHPRAVDLLSVRRQFVRLAADHGSRRSTRCELRGYCGPFANEEYYDAFPEPMWHGMGDCLECGTTCHVSQERQREGSSAA